MPIRVKCPSCRIGWMTFGRVFLFGDDDAPEHDMMCDNCAQSLYAWHKKHPGSISRSDVAALAVLDLESDRVDLNYWAGEGFPKQWLSKDDFELQRRSRDSEREALRDDAKALSETKENGERLQPRFERARADDDRRPLHEKVGTQPIERQMQPVADGFANRRARGNGLVFAVVAALLVGGFWSANNTSWGCELTGGTWLSAESWIGSAAGKFDDQCWRMSGSRQPSDPGDCQPGLPRSMGGC